MVSGDPFGLIGQVLDGQFRVDAFIGEGGFSIVYKGMHLGLEEPIGIKCLKLPPALGSALVESFIRRFRDESRIHYRLSQGNLHICRSMASGTTMAPATSALVPYMVLEWLEGQSLAQELDARRAARMTGRPLHEAVRLLDPAVEAVAYAHAQGVVHRDLNTGNLFVARTREGYKLKVLDFGVAKIVSDHALELGPRAQTIGQIRIFSPAYGAPEQFDDKVGMVGPWTDVYALALIVLEVMRDQTVIEGEHIGEYAMKALDTVVRPTPRTLGLAVGDEVEAAFARALSVDPRQRPQDAGELWGELKNAMRRDHESGRPPHAGPAQTRDVGRPSVSPPAAFAPRGSSPAVEVLRPGSIVPPPPVAGAMGSRPGAKTMRMSNPSLGRADGSGASSFPPAPQMPTGFGSAPPFAAAPPAAYGSTPHVSVVPADASTMTSAMAATLPGPVNTAAAWAAAQRQQQYGPPPTAPANGTPMTPVPPQYGGNPYGAAPLPSLPPAPYPSDPSMGGYRPSRPSMAAPAPAGVSAPSKTPIVVAVVVVALLVLGGAAFALSAWRGAPPKTQDAPPVVSSVPAQLAPAVPVSAPAVVATPVETPTPRPAIAQTAVPAPSAPITPTPAPARPTSVPTPTTRSAIVDAPAPTSTPPQPIPTPFPNTSTVTAFNPTAAKAALDMVNGILASCKAPGGGGVTGPGHLVVTFRNDGSIGSALVDRPPYLATPEGACVESRFRTARMKPFEGTSPSAEYTFVVPK